MSRKSICATKRNVKGCIPQPNAKRGYDKSRNPLIFMVGARGFEPPTPCSRSRCATRLRYAPTKKKCLYHATCCSGKIFLLPPTLGTRRKPGAPPSRQPPRNGLISLVDAVFAMPLVDSMSEAPTTSAAVVDHLHRWAAPEAGERAVTFRHDTPYAAPERGRRHAQGHAQTVSITAPEGPAQESRLSMED